MMEFDFSCNCLNFVSFSTSHDLNSPYVVGITCAILRSWKTKIDTLEDFINVIGF